MKWKWDTYRSMWLFVLTSVNQCQSFQRHPCRCQSGHLPHRLNLQKDHRTEQFKVLLLVTMICAWRSSVMIALSCPHRAWSCHREGHGARNSTTVSSSLPLWCRSRGSLSYVTVELHSPDSRQFLGSFHAVGIAIETCWTWQCRFSSVNQSANCGRLSSSSVCPRWYDGQMSSMSSTGHCSLMSASQVLQSS